MATSMTTSLSTSKPHPLPRLNGTGQSQSPVQLRGQEYSSSEGEEDPLMDGSCAECEECARNQATSGSNYDDHTGQQSRRSTGESYTWPRSRRSTGESYKGGLLSSETQGRCTI